MSCAVAINREQEIVVLDCGCTLKMQNFMDRFGDDTDDPNEAVSAVALHGYEWLVIDLTVFVTVLKH